MKLKVLKGLPASGKSTWAKKFVKENKDWVRVNRDDLRNMRGEYWVPKQEDLITQWEDFAIKSALKAGYNVILDATNLNDDRNRNREFVLGMEFPQDIKVEYMTFHIDIEDAIKRDLARPNSVGEAVIRRMYDKYLAPPPVVYEDDESLPWAYIFDVDGTLAKMHNRGPYDWNKVGDDHLNLNVSYLFDALEEQGVKMIIFTGRDGSCLKETKSWLYRMGINYDEIYIRPEGDTRKDAVVKKEMFENHIRGKYCVKGVFDDRNQVVDMWRKELGLTCFQVDYGNF